MYHILYSTKVVRNQTLVFIGLVFLLTFSVRLTGNAISITLPLITKYQLDFPVIFLGILLSEYSFMMFISSFFINSRLDDKKRTILFRIFSIVYFLSFVSFSFTNKISIWIFDGIAGFTMGFLWPNIITFAESTKDNELREKILSLYSAFLSLSLIIGPLIESLILKKYGLNYVFLFLSLIAVLIPIISIKIEFSDQQQQNNVNNNLSIIKSKAFMISFFNNLMYDIPFGMITAFGGIYAISEFGASYSISELIYTFFFLTSFISRLFFSFIVNSRINIRKIIFSNGLLTLIGLILMLTSKDILYYIIALIILGIPHGLTYTSSLILLSRNFGNQKNQANSYFSGVLLGLGSVGPLFLSSIVQEFNLKNTIILITVAVVAIFSWVLFLFHKNR
ncbi:MFS transporter [Acidianus sulfidivorans JP7]|uniref:MFS transporter n=1 Tax=Acidianus sulfidivorans JP7 TaxID=619593 RepID=A0A2U9ILW5_9CREN|nr:MFS transporter [Acidianus sulfidivorans JP7]